MFEVVGKIVRQRRIKLGLTIAQLAEKACVSDSYVSSIELGSVQNARIVKLNDLAQALYINLGDRFIHVNKS